ncbi:MAG: hypothetical protein KKG76_11020 [Euryarchaeota archaeon]|nr:hypothetical protein [Euryarchaeota archaeon]MBU4140111.1 hypothetical protein [Euryarchaeota archaeon]
MKILIVIFTLVAGVVFSGCTEGWSTQETDLLPTDSIQVPADAPKIVPTDTPEPTPFVTTVIPLTKYDKFVVWLKEDLTNKHPYIYDPSKVYEDQYVCAQFTRDFLKNASDAGFETYAVLLTGAVNGQNAWHTINAIILDGKLYFVEPQKDIIFKKEDLLKTYGFEYAYFGKEVYISRNDAELSQKINYHSVIGLNGDNFLYLK